VNPLVLIRDRIEQLWLKRWYLKPRMKGVRLDLQLDLSMPGKGVRAVAELSFRPQADAKVMVCGIGDVKVHGASWKGKAVKARVNAPFLVLKFPEKLSAFTETKVQVRYSYQPDEYGSVRLPLTGAEIPLTLRLTCRRPLLALSQGSLVQGTEKPPLRTYEWASPRSRKINAIVADVRSFKKEGPDGTRFWLHVHADSTEFVPRILDLIIATYEESVAAHHKKLDHADYHVIEADERHATAFNSSGLIVLPRGSFRTADKPTIAGVLTPELNKEWGREALRLQTSGSRD
jgi:hypothetical protein